MDKEFVPATGPDGTPMFIQPEAQKSGSHQFTDFLIHEIDGLGMREKLVRDFFSFHSGNIDNLNVRHLRFLSPDGTGYLAPHTEFAEVTEEGGGGIAGVGEGDFFFFHVFLFTEKVRKLEKEGEDLQSVEGECGKGGCHREAAVKKQTEKYSSSPVLSRAGGCSGKSPNDRRSPFYRICEGREVENIQKTLCLSGFARHRKNKKPAELVFISFCGLQIGCGGRI